MTTIHQLLEETNSDSWAVDPDDSVFNAISEMALRNVGALLVMEGEKLSVSSPSVAIRAISY